MVGFATGFWFGNLARDLPGTVSVTGPLQSVVITGGSPAFANSMYYDNLRALVPAVIDPVIGGPADPIDPDPRTPDVTPDIDQPTGPRKTDPSIGTPG